MSTIPAANTAWSHQTAADELCGSNTYETIDESRSARGDQRQRYSHEDVDDHDYLEPVLADDTAVRGRRQPATYDNSPANPRDSDGSEPDYCNNPVDPASRADSPDRDDRASDSSEADYYNSPVDPAATSGPSPKPDSSGHDDRSSCDSSESDYYNNPTTKPADSSVRESRVSDSSEPDYYNNPTKRADFHSPDSDCSEADYCNSSEAR